MQSDEADPSETLGHCVFFRRGLVSEIHQDVGGATANLLDDISGIGKDS